MKKTAKWATYTVTYDLGFKGNRQVDYIKKYTGTTQDFLDREGITAGIKHYKDKSEYVQFYVGSIHYHVMF